MPPGALCLAQGKGAAMTIAEFKLAPWKTSHEKYKESVLAISPAPEYASSEVLVAALCRTIGFQDASEGGVPQAGRELDRRIKRYRDKNQRPADATIDAETWHAVLHGALESPKLPKQSSNRFLQVSPLVPAITRFSGSARLSSNSWPAGSLVRRMVWIGSLDKDSANVLWRDLFDALNVTEGDDIFARWLQHETEAWSEAGLPGWTFASESEKEMPVLSPSDINHVQFPARQFVKDLRAIIQAKSSMTRRQWTSILEAIVRLASAAHVIWLCDVQARIWACIEAAIDMGGPSGEAEARNHAFPAQLRYMSYGNKAVSSIKDRVSGYLRARMGINATLWTLDACGASFKGDLSSSSNIASLCQHIRDNAKEIAAAGIHDTVLEVNEREARTLLCRKGIGSNIMEFMTHVLGQRQSAVELLRGYDQGYILKKKSKRSTWIVSLGPVSAIAIVHCALSGMGGPRSIHRLSQHLSAYGITIDRHDIVNNDLGHQLRMLGLVLDSPDAESGMLLLPPFPTSNMPISTSHP